MVEAAEYIYAKLESDSLLRRAFEMDTKEKRTQDYGVVLVGHSLGAGAAAILGALLLLFPDGKFMGLIAAVHPTSSVIVTPILSLHLVITLRLPYTLPSTPSTLNAWLRGGRGELSPLINADFNKMILCALRAQSLEIDSARQTISVSGA
jgi:pimeloyl-ACP methyl ester carboxylesterase